MSGTLKFAYLICFVFTAGSLCSQNAYQVNISKTDVGCDKASAGLEIKNQKINDTLRVSWSNGLAGFTSVNDLTQGDYQVNVKINSKFDTTIFFTIEKVICEIKIPKQFTPNGDGYRDQLEIARTENYPNFEFEIFNKWGQLIHSQRSSYTPWDGTWAGNTVPDGVYYYVFYYDKNNKHQLVKGDITVIR